MLWTLMLWTLMMSIGVSFTRELEGVIRTAITYSEDIETELCRIFLPLVKTISRINFIFKCSTY